MALRKLIAFGSSYVVSVPKDWVRKSRIKKGDTLNVEERDADLVISASKLERRKQLKEITISANDKKFAVLKAEMTSAYVSNFNMITVTGNDLTKMSKMIKTVFYELVGVEVIEETTTKIVAKDLMDISEVSIDNVLRRMDILTRSMFDDLSSADENKSETISERDREVNRLALLSFRVTREAFENPRIMKLFKTNHFDLMISKQVVTQLEIIADQLKMIAYVLGKKEANENVKPLFLRVYPILKKHYLKVMKIYYTKDKQAAFDIEVETISIMKQIADNLKKQRKMTCAMMADYLHNVVISLLLVSRSTMEHE
ncbi:MAG: phosphate uptake regulator PhoU [bacterium]|nr:phosphate uptake regulator PhoU [bacterium]